MTTTIIGFPRFGENRELKFATERYFRREINQTELLNIGKALRKKHWALLASNHITEIPSNDFSFYDTTLDTAVLFNIIPQEVKALGFCQLDTYFALARGYQGEHGDVKALPMKKWFNTNYHYLVPQFEDATEIKVNGTKIFDEYLEAKSLGYNTRPVILGPFSLLSLTNFNGQSSVEKAKSALVSAYREVIERLAELGATHIQLEEPSLVKDLTQEDIALFVELYEALYEDGLSLKVLLQTYFGDVRDVYETLIKLPFDAIGLDFVEGKRNLELVQQYGFPTDKRLYAGVIKGKNIWRNNYQLSLDILKELPKDQVTISTSCSLLHVPYTVENESFSSEITRHFAFAKEKLTELNELASIYFDEKLEALTSNQQLFDGTRIQRNEAVQAKLNVLTEESFVRLPKFEEREAIQKDVFKLPLLPTTTIGSFPQTQDVKQNRAKFKKGEISQEEYETFNEKKIVEWLRFQEKVGLDVLVHGEFERNDMVEYFGEHLDGYLFSQKAWVQSYGTRGVKPPIVWGDISRTDAMTVRWSKFAQSQTQHVVKGMLTGPVTILNWSFPREDISLKESTLQIALAIQEEVLDLEANGIRIIQIDEAALREKLPLRQSDWYSEYLDWAIPAFRLVHSQVKAETQIHTHMCYSEFTDIIRAIDDLDADVISFEASRSNLDILDSLKAHNFQTQVGPGVYDIHSPRVPSVEEIEATIHRILEKVPVSKVWINPDCGLKTRQDKETQASLENLTQAAKNIRGVV